MADNTSQSASGSIGLTGATFLVFLVLKLTGAIDWSWWWVTAPLWGGAVLGIGFLGATYLILAGVARHDRVKRHRAIAARNARRLGS